MKGTILIVDGVATNRIMLKVLMSAAYYRVVQTDCTEGLGALIRRTSPDVILTAMSLPDGTAMTVLKAARGTEDRGPVPVIAVARENDRPARLQALAAGIDDVLVQPFDDRLLQARVRSVIRARDADEDLRLRDGTSRALGFAEPAAGFSAPKRVALLAADLATAARWKARLSQSSRHVLESHHRGDLLGLMTGKHNDAIVLQLGSDQQDSGLRLLAELRAQGATRHAAILAIAPPDQAGLAADALDMGADDAICGAFDPEEMALRLDQRLQRKARADLLRDTVRTGLRAAMQDPLTGLYNRRYALPCLARLARRAATAGHGFAIMLADLDHFKQINDRHGHPAGDAVLVEAARRLQRLLGKDDLIARVGGEEFLIVLAETTAEAAARQAETVRRCIGTRPFAISGITEPVQVTTSIGLVAIPAPPQPLPTPAGLASAEALIGCADRALYRAKGAGRDQVTRVSAA